jgi:hypothetical protein
VSKNSRNDQNAIKHASKQYIEVSLFNLKLQFSCSLTLFGPEKQASNEIRKRYEDYLVNLHLKNRLLYFCRFEKRKLPDS